MNIVNAETGPIAQYIVKPLHIDSYIFIKNIKIIIYSMPIIYPSDLNFILVRFLLGVFISLLCVIDFCFFFGLPLLIYF